MEDKTFNKILAFIGALVLVGLIYDLVKRFNEETETNVITDDGLKALQDPSKKKMIDDAIEKARLNQIKTGIWKNPEVDLS